MGGNLGRTKGQIGAVKHINNLNSPHLKKPLNYNK